MQILTFDEILVDLCDYFDSLISPRTISRSNTNIVYLLLKAFAKGCEVINNVCFALSSKFDPANCEPSDLESVASLVGTARLEGSVSGLRVTAYNNGIHTRTLYANEYIYKYDADTTFKCVVPTNVAVEAERSVTLMFLSEEVGSYPVTSQANISLSSEAEISSDFIFSCADNEELLGHNAETSTEFRKRILADTNRQDAINELEVKLKNLPYVYDCTIVFNRNTSIVSVGSFSILPYYMLVMLSTAKYDNEIAKVIAESAIYPTVNVDGSSHALDYVNSVFADGKYVVYVNDFVKKEFSALITMRADPAYISSEQARTKIRSALLSAVNTNVHKDEITTEDFYDILNELNIAGVKILGVAFEVNGDTTTYVSCLKTEIADLVSVNFSELA